MQACETVPPGAEGFRVDTPSAQVVDLGTAFGIEQFADGTSKVSVFDGANWMNAFHLKTQLITQTERFLGRDLQFVL